MEPNITADPAATRGDKGNLRVTVVWPVRFMREILVETLERNPQVSVVAQCADISEAIALNPTLLEDIVLLDARIPEGREAVRQALDIAPGMRIVASAVKETVDDIIAWAEAGVIGYIPRTAPLTDFVRLIAGIHRGEQLCSGRVATGLLRRIAFGATRGAPRSAVKPTPALTKRERQTAELIGTGLSDKEIARRLNISLATTKSHVHNLLGKLNMQRRSQVADYLHQHYQNGGYPIIG